MTSPKRTRLQAFKHAFSSPSAFRQALVLSSSTSFLINEDLAPSPPSKQTWTVWSFFAYWWSESWCVSTWAVGSSMITLGASIRDSLIVVFFANLFSALVIVLNGRAAARYHIGFPVVARASFGIYGHYFAVCLRCMVSIIWGGVNLYFQGQFISICLRCIFPGWNTMKNPIPKSQEITIQTLIGYILAFFTTLPFVFIHTSKIQKLFHVKSVVMPAAGLGIVIWAITTNGGVGSQKLEQTAPPVSSAVYAWGMIAQVNSVLGINSALLVTVPDLARYSKTQNAQVWGQILSLPLGQTLCAAFGILSTSAVFNLTGKSFWNPYDLLHGILDYTSYSSGARAGIFFASFSFAFATLGTSIACNFIPLAADVTALLPKYINIIRAQLLCLIVAFSIVPWRIIGSSASGFLNFLDGYCIFQGPIVSIMLVDYFLIRRGNLLVNPGSASSATHGDHHIAASPDSLGDSLASREEDGLYTASAHGRYFYLFGFNIRAFLAFIAGFLIPLPGFIQSFNPTHDNKLDVASKLVTLGWLLSFFIAGMVYWIECFIFPVPGNDGDHGFETARIYTEEWKAERVPHTCIDDAEVLQVAEEGKIEKHVQQVQVTISS
ncbi:hypothetical protein LTR84_010960 [Exophiala bonariae]|uniref:NCS1 nucleoside transporter n=1 Tax=Exophiala bonariae TaxID=1690606 RepID=A0AAV9NK99_9EURO|nr:hypothetical protein LTR84_010960 [Exophiala bonariae]